MGTIQGTRTPRVILPSIRGVRRLYCDRCGTDLAESSRPGTRVCRDCRADPMYRTERRES